MGIPSVATAIPKRCDFADGELVSVQQQITITEQIRKTTHGLEKLLLGRAGTELLVCSKPGTWCVAECLNHLTQTTLAFLPAISAAIASAPRLTRDRRLRTGIIPSLFIWNLKPPYRIRFTVLPQLAPQYTDSETAWSNFVDSQRQLVETVRSAAGLAIDKVTIKSPVYARLSYNIYSAFRMLVAHQNRHVWQMQQILKSLDQPAGSNVA